MDEEEMLFGMSKLIDSENENEYDRNPEIIIIKTKRMKEDNEEKISPLMKLLYDDEIDNQSPNDESISEDVEEYLFKPSKLLYDDSKEMADEKEKNKTMKNKDIFFVDENQFKDFKDIKDIKEKDKVDTNCKFSNKETIKEMEKEILNNQQQKSNNKELNNFNNNETNNNNLSKGNNKEIFVKEKRIILNKNTPKYQKDKNIIENKRKDCEIKKIYYENNEKEEKVKDDENKNNEKEDAIKVRYGRYRRQYYKMLNEKKKDIDSFDEKHDKEKAKEDKIVKKEKEEKKDNILLTEPSYQRKYIRNNKINLELKNGNENNKENENMLTTIKPYYRRKFMRDKNINERTENEKSNKNEVKYERKLYINNQIEKDKNQKEKDKNKSEKENITNRNNNEGIIYRFKNYQINTKDKDKKIEKEMNKREVGLIKPNKYYYGNERNIRIEETLIKETKTWKQPKLNKTVEEKDTNEETDIYSKRRRYKNISDLTAKSIKNEIKEMPKLNEIPIKKRIYQRKERKEEDGPNHYFQRTFYGRLYRRNDLSNQIKDEDHKIKEDKYTYYTKYNIRSNRDILSTLSSPYKYISSYKRRNEIAGNNNNNGNNFKQNLELNHPIRNQNNKTEETVKILNQNRTAKYLLTNNNKYFRNKINETKDNDRREIKNGIIRDNNTTIKLPNNHSFTRKTYFYSKNNK